MTTSPLPDSRTDWQAVVAVRIPPTDDADLRESARRRLQGADDDWRVTVQDLRAIEPGMPATTVTVAVRVEAPPTLTDDSIDGLLSEAPGTETVREVSAA